MRECIVIVHVSDIEHLPGRTLVCFDGDKRDGVTVSRRVLDHLTKLMKRCAAQWLDRHFSRRRHG